MRELTKSEIREEIESLVAEYHAAWKTSDRFVPGKTPVHYAGRVFDEREIQAAVAASLDFWLTEGAHAERFQKDLAMKLGVRETVLVNSGSSANLLAVTALTSPLLKERRLKPGDEVITPGRRFPHDGESDPSKRPGPRFYRFRPAHVQPAAGRHRRCRRSPDTGRFPGPYPGKPL
ncbi:MAG: DegT/DnrJ/EryC1/StrS family aminotransferase [Syntrophales bacterium]